MYLGTRLSLHDVILTPLIPMLPGTSTRKLVMMVPGYIGNRGLVLQSWYQVKDNTRARKYQVKHVKEETHQ